MLYDGFSSSLDFIIVFDSYSVLTNQMGVLVLLKEFAYFVFVAFVKTTTTQTRNSFVMPHPG